MSLVSVIIPNYNHGAFLQKRIESVLNQTYRSIEIIILDDASTDNSKAIIEQYRQHPLVKTIVYNPVNSGSTFLQWEKGIKLAGGKYIWIAESDDWCEPVLLKELVENAETDEQCAISYCQSYCVDVEGNIKWQSAHRKVEECIDGALFVKTYMGAQNAIFNASMAIWKRNLYSKISHDYKNYKYAGDMVFWIRLAMEGRVAISGKLLNYFLKHEKDVSGKAIRSGLGVLEQMKILNLQFEESMIDKGTYYRGYKRLFRDFWRIRHAAEAPLGSEIRNLFRNARVSKWYGCRVTMGAVWAEIKKR
ncbi:glycosyltransferase [Niabella hirudinis]|uniref:glycosyltransferase n=1 Tax=Niabella hirudinis TaxID=1285929 RepID=UPI003EB6A74A